MGPMTRATITTLITRAFGRKPTRREILAVRKPAIWVKLHEALEAERMYVFECEIRAAHIALAPSWRTTILARVCPHDVPARAEDLRIAQVELARDARKAMQATRV